MLACESFDGEHVWHNRRTLPADFFSILPVNRTHHEQILWDGCSD